MKINTSKRETKSKRYSQNSGDMGSPYCNVLSFIRLSTGRPISASTNTLGAASNECFYRLLGFYFDQKRDTPPSNEPNNEPTIGKAKALISAQLIVYH